MPSPRAAHGIAKLGRQVFVFGGRHDTTRLSDLYVIDMADLFWTRSGEHIYHWHCSCLESHGADITAVIGEKNLEITAAVMGGSDIRVASVLDSGTEVSGFKLQLRRCQVTVLGKLFTPIVPLFTKQRNW